jgi:hypothetical protein
VVIGAVGLTSLIVAGVLRTGSTPDPPDAGARSAVPAPAAPGSVPAEVIRLLDGLAVGDKLGGFSVFFLRVVEKNTIGVDLKRGPSLVTVWISRKGARRELPPRETELYAIAYGIAPGGPRLENAELEPVLAEVEARVRRNERRVPVPPGF